MAWGSLLSSTQLTLDENYDTVLRSAADWEIELNPGEIAQVIFDFNPEATPSENCDIIIPLTADGTLYESDGEAQRQIIEFSNSESDDPAVRSVTIAGVWGFKIRARVRDPDDTAGTDDTASTLDVDIRIDGVSI
jgi:hypothetical protein